MSEKISIFWFRRDLRVHDNRAFYEALNGEHPVQPVFIFDRKILDDLEEKADQRLGFIHWALRQVNKKLHIHRGTLETYYGFPEDIFKELSDKYDLAAVYCNRDYEPYARERDGNIQKMLEEKGIAFHTFKDQVIFERDEVQKKGGGPYTVFTPYSRTWRDELSNKGIQSYPSENHLDNLVTRKAEDIHSLESMGFEDAGWDFPDKDVDEDTFRQYKEKRDYPAERGTSRLGVHLRHGTISVRKLFDHTEPLSSTFTNELIWREFYMQIMWSFPRVEHESFRKEYDKIPWRNNEEEFEKWCQGKTGFPIVDAGMRQLNTIGYMHNRVRMVVASFLTKHLLIDWRWGEAYFGKKLLDYELSSNNGGWQWAAGCGTDAAPYFRIFNPTTQIEKYDKDYNYIKRWVKEFGTDEYPEPIVDHKEARQRCLDTYKSALDK